MNEDFAEKCCAIIITALNDYKKAAQKRLKSWWRMLFKRKTLTRQRINLANDYIRLIMIDQHNYKNMSKQNITKRLRSRIICAIDSSIHRTSIEYKKQLRMRSFCGNGCLGIFFRRKRITNYIPTNHDKSFIFGGSLFYKKMINCIKVINCFDNYYKKENLY